jgi:hypothetical protein
MALLRIDLQDGFSADAVILRVNETEAFRRKSVTTSILLGYAHSLALDVPEGTATVELEMPTRELVSTVQVRITDAGYLEFSVVDGEIIHRTSD